MSTRSSLFYSESGNHIWEETNEPIYWFDKFVGWNIYGGISFDELKEVVVKDGRMKLSFKSGSYFNCIFPEGLVIDGGSLIEFELDDSGIEFGIKGDSGTAIQLRKKNAGKYEIPPSREFLNIDTSSNSVINDA